MYRSRSLASVGAALLVAAPGLAVSSGAPEGSTGAPGEQTCAACHSGGARTGRMSITFPEAGGYTPGQRFRMRVTIEDPTASRWGFQLTARAGSATAGTLAAADGNSGVLSLGPQQWITHTTNGTRRGTTRSIDFDFDWTAPATDAGAVTFYAAGNAANGNLTETGDSIYTTTLNVTPQTSGGGGPRPTFTASSVTDIYSGRAGMAPGAWVSITGTELAGREANWSPIGGRPIPTQLGGVTVKVNDVAAPLSFVSPTKITLLVPGSVPAGNAPVVIERDGQAAPAVTVAATAVLPAVYSVADSSGRLYALVAPSGGAALGFVNTRGSLLGKPDVDPRVSRAAAPGEEIEIFATGLGRTEGDFSTDRLLTGPLTLATAPMVRFGDTAVTPSAAAMISPGIYAVRARIPESTAAGDVPLVLDFSGTASSSSVLLTVAAP